MTVIDDIMSGIGIVARTRLLALSRLATDERLLSLTLSLISGYKQHAGSMRLPQLGPLVQLSARCVRKDAC